MELAALGLPAQASHNAAYAALAQGVDEQETAAAWVDGAAYQFGGWGWTPDGPVASRLVATDAIWKYDPATDARTLMGAKLPDGLWGLTAIATDDGIYLFGGLGSGTYPLHEANDRVLRYDPASDTLTVLSATTTPSFTGAAGVWDGGDRLYLFGGFDAVAGATAYESVAVRAFDRSTGQFSVLPAVLPVPGGHDSAVWVGDRALVFAGDPHYVVNGDVKEPGQVLAYDPALGAVVVETLLADRHSLIHSAGWTKAVWTGEHAYVFLGDGGGHIGTVRYDPSTREVRAMLAGRYLCHMPPWRDCQDPLPLSGPAVWDGAGHAYILGEAAGDIYRYTPSLDRPAEFEDWLGIPAPEPGPDPVPAETPLPHPLGQAIGQACARLDGAPAVGPMLQASCNLLATVPHMVDPRP